MKRVERGLGAEFSMVSEKFFRAAWPLMEYIVQAYPAMQATEENLPSTIVPNFLITGILAIIMGIIVAVWAAGYIERKNGGLILILLSIIMLLVGGGIIPPIIGVIGGIIGTRIKPK